jgi:hypothetical protein
MVVDLARMNHAFTRTTLLSLFYHVWLTSEICAGYSTRAWTAPLPAHHLAGAHLKRLW